MRPFARHIDSAGPMPVGPTMTGRQPALRPGGRRTATAVRPSSGPPTAAGPPAGRRGHRADGQPPVDADRAVHDVVVVGGGPVGLLLRLLAGRGRLGRGRGREEALPAGQDLRRRAHPPRRAPAGRHGPRGRPGRVPPYTGLRAHAFGQVARAALARAPALPLLRLHHHPPRPRRPGGRAGGQGRGHPAGRAPRWSRRSSDDGGRRPARSPAPRPLLCRRRWSRTRRRGADPRASRPATSWWPTGPTRGSAGCSAPTGDRDLPLGMALRGYYTLGPPRRSLHRVPPRHPRRRRRRRARLRLDLPAWATGGSTSASACSPPTSAGRASTPRTSWTPSSTWRPKSWGLCPETCLGPPTGGKLPMGLSVGPRAGGNVWSSGDAAGSINPFNGEGIAYGYETRPAGRRRARATRCAATGIGALAELRPRSSTTPTGPTSRWPGPSSGSSANPSS